VTMDEQVRMALGRVCYEAFAEQRVAAGNGMPPWKAGPRGEGLPEREMEIWAHVAEAVAAAIPFVITREVVEAFGAQQTPRGTAEQVWRNGLRAAALAAGFRVEER
jgi:hypothetical protein